MDQTPAPGQPDPSGIATPRRDVGTRNDGQSSSSPPLPTASGLPRPSTSSGLAMTEGTSGHPEIKAGPIVSPEVGEIEVIPESPEISPELAEHVERVIRGEIELPGPIEVGTHEGQPVTIQPAAPQQSNIILPLTRADFTAGPGQPVSSSWRWLYEFVKRIILMFPGRAVYRDL